MANDKLARATEVFSTLCNTLDSMNLRYERDDEKLVIDITVRGDDLPMRALIEIDPERELVRLLSPMPFKIDDEKRIETAIATSIVNNMLVDGSFDFNINSGDLYFRMTNSFRDSDIGPALLKYMFDVSMVTIDEYNDKFFMLNKGKMDFRDFL